MSKKELTEKIEAPQGVTISRDANELTISGPKGSVKRKFNNPKIKLEAAGNVITMSVKAASKREKAVLHAYVAHLKNYFEGVQNPFVYKLKICSGHFPMNVSISNKTLIIKNFLGEKVPRQVKLKEGVTIKVDGNSIVLESPDKELAGQTAADIEQATRRPGFDPRIFQDGIYIIEKSGKMI